MSLLDHRTELVPDETENVGVSKIVVAEAEDRQRDDNPVRQVPARARRPIPSTTSEASTSPHLSTCSSPRVPPGRRYFLCTSLGRQSLSRWVASAPTALATAKRCCGRAQIGDISPLVL
jgi:hypothetical protein